MTRCMKCQSTDVVDSLPLCKKCLFQAASRENQSVLCRLDEPSLTNATKSNWDVAKCIANSRRTQHKPLLVDSGLEKSLLPHQREGVEFIVGNCLADYHDRHGRVRGCIVAHEMGLGKCLTTITSLHTMMNNPCIVDDAKKRVPVRHVLLLAPANVVNNWDDEAEKWTKDMEHPMTLINLQKIQHAMYRTKDIKKWKKEGGILIMSPQLYRRQHAKEIEKSVDVLVLDEGHTMIKSSKTIIIKELQGIETPRRIILTGTPMQNNTSELYQLVRYVDPLIIPDAPNATTFDKLYRKPIEAGLANSDDPEAQEKSTELQMKLNRIVQPILHRRGKECIQDRLPAKYDTLLTLQQGCVQQTVLQEYDRICRNGFINKNFFRRFRITGPLLNHPYCLNLMVGDAEREKGSKKSHHSQEALDFLCQKLSRKCRVDRLKDTRNSPKFIILSHILFLAKRSQEKVLVFSQCRKTLMLICDFLESGDWKKQIQSLSCFGDLELGRLKKNKDFLSMDGDTNPAKRADLVERFNNDDRVRIFVLSPVACGIGTNLTAASRVVLLDNHFNPSVGEQCVARAHRIGQHLPVHCYRLATEGSLETKVYARCQNKTGVASCVIEGDDWERSFSRRELENLEKIDFWVQCSECDKRRLLSTTSNKDVPQDDEYWICEMNEDHEYNACSKPEQGHAVAFRRGSDGVEDPFLRHLIGVVNRATKHTPLVTGWSPVHTNSELMDSPDRSPVASAASTALVEQPRKRKAEMQSRRENALVNVPNAKDEAKYEENSFCCICQSAPSAEVLSNIDGCSHSFCFGCIAQWAGREKTCPACKTRFTKITLAS